MSQLDAHTVDGLTEIFRVLGDPTRVRILDALSRTASRENNRWHTQARNGPVSSALNRS